MRIMSFKMLAGCAVTIFLATPLSGQNYSEVGDAGQTPATAQGTGAGALSSISGNLPATTDADLFQIFIGTPASFSATTTGLASGGGAIGDTALYLFTSGGFAVYANDNASGLTNRSTLPAGHALSPSSAGNYILGIAPAGYIPVDINGVALFTSNGPTAVRGPNPIAGALAGFDDDGTTGDSGLYRIDLTGAAAVPEPTTITLVFLSAVALFGRTVRNRR